MISKPQLASQPPVPPAILSAKKMGSWVELFLTDGHAIAVSDRLAFETLIRDLPESAILAELSKLDAVAINLQLTEDLDDINWEAVPLPLQNPMPKPLPSEVTATSGATAQPYATLGQRFAISRFIVAQADSAQLPSMNQASMLRVYRLDAAAMKSPSLAPRSIDCDIVEVVAATRLPDGMLRVFDALTAKPLLVFIHLGAAQLTTQIKKELLLKAGALIVYQASNLGDSYAAGTNTESIVKKISNAWLVGAKLSDVIRTVLSPVQLNNVRMYGDSVRVDPVTIAPERQDQDIRQVTSMSFDLMGSTDLMAQLGSERYSMLLHEFHRTCQDIIVSFGGRPDEPQGDDGIMAYFGYPVAVEGATRKAVLAGLQMTKVMQSMGLQIRVGIAVGRVAVRAAQPVGLSVHLAARLQSMAAANSVLLSSDTELLVRDNIDCEQLSQTAQLKGFQGPNSVYLAKHAKVAVRGVQLSRIARRRPLIGRQSDLAELKDAFKRVSTGVGASTGSLTLVIGEAGIGKSRLIAELRRSLAGQGVTFFVLRGDIDQQMSAFRPLIHTLTEWIEHSQLGGAALSQAVSVICPEALREFDLLAEPLILHLLDPVNYTVPSLAADQVRERTFELLVRWIGIGAAEKPYCILVDDAQWLDPSTREIFDRLKTSLRSTSVMIVMTIRSEADSGWRPAARYETLELSRLTAAQSLEFVQSDAALQKLPVAQLQQLIDSAEGVPLFLEESVKMLVARGEALRADSSSNAVLVRVPSTIEELLMARLDQVGSAKQIAQVAAVIGRDFNRALLELILIEVNDAAGSRNLDFHLSELLRHGLIVKADIEGQASNYRFKHGLIRDTAYHGLWEHDRLTLHRTTATVMSISFAQMIVAQPELLAHHHTFAGQLLEAVQEWEKAAKLASSRSAQLESIKFLLTALEVLERLPSSPTRDAIELRLRLSLASRYIATEGYGANQVKATYARAAELAIALGDKVAERKVELGLEAFHFMRAEFDQALLLATAKLTRGRELTVQQPWDRLLSQWAQANIYWHQGHMPLALELMNECLDSYNTTLHRPNSLQDPAVMCFCYSAWSYWEMGDDNEAAHRLNQALDLAKQLNHAFSLAVVYGFMATLELFNGRFAQAFHHSNLAFKASRDGNFRVWLAHSQMAKGRALAGLGDVDLGLAEMTSAYTAWVTTGAVVTRPFYLTQRAEALIEAGRSNDAQPLLDESLALIQGNSECYHHAEILRLKASLVKTSDAQTSREKTSREQRRALLLQSRDLAINQGKTRFALKSALALCRSESAPEVIRGDRNILATIVRAHVATANYVELNEARQLINTSTVSENN